MPQISAEFWDRRYAKGLAYGAEPNGFLKSTADKYFVGGESVLLVGEGEGRNALYLSKEHHAHCLAIDWSGVGLQRCRKTAESQGLEIETRVMDLSDFTSSDQRNLYDAIVNIHCSLQSKEATLALHRQLLATLRCGGLFVVELFAPGSDLGPREAERLIEPIDLHFDHLEILLLEKVQCLLHEGTYHASDNPQSLSRLVARKRAYSRYDRFLLTSAARIQGCQSIDTDETDLYLSHASWLGSRALTEARRGRRCLGCWTPRQACYCGLLQTKAKENIFFRDNTVLLCHPLEFLRSTSSGRLLAQLYDTRLYVYGLVDDMDILFKTNRVFVLYPDENDDSPIMTFHPKNDTLLIPDGSWKQTQAMVASLKRRWPQVCSLGLRPEIIQRLRPASSVVDAIRPGNGKGRLSTFEAACLASYQITGQSPDDAFQALDETLVPVIRNTRPFLNTKPAPNLQWTSCENRLRILARAFQRAAKEGHRPSSARSCPLCRISLASPNRMRDHVIGRRHCLAVASAYLQSQGKLAKDDDQQQHSLPDDIAAAFYSLSTLPILHQPATVLEPPDAALCALQEEILAKSSN